MPAKKKKETDELEEKKSSPKKSSTKASEKKTTKKATAKSTVKKSTKKEKEVVLEEKDQNNTDSVTKTEFSKKKPIETNDLKLFIFAAAAAGDLSAQAKAAKFDRPADRSGENGNYCKRCERRPGPDARQLRAPGDHGQPGLPDTRDQ